ncbi:unnamed protein product [Gongylonema pulchrum]|uniref:Holocytochrome c-type synthase n=1 Tax=Gongylonema pulchrum TaxID=637853 RepID=A0A183D8X2_9BILA|nr:unnamed protein product [Gongylonema pulchrum]
MIPLASDSVSKTVASSSFSAAEGSVTGDADVKSGTPRQVVRSSPICDIASPTASSPSGTSVKRRQTWERDFGVQVPRNIDKWDEERKKYWTYQNIYHIPIPDGIEFWEQEDKERWELVHIAGMNEGEAEDRLRSNVTYLAF